MNERLFRAKMAEYGDTQETLAEALGISRTRLNAKINGVADFRQMEILFIKGRYNLTPSDIDAIFFTKKVS